MGRKLKLWNGRPYGVLPAGEWKLGADTAHVYVCAYSVADLKRLCEELGLYAPSNHEVSVYWNSGHWGDAMDGITPERGVWVGYGYSSKPERIVPEEPQP